jgi:uncharacterized protein (TIGR00369 family)
MPNRSGPFWDGIEGRAPVPRAAATLGFQFINADVENGTIEVAFDATEDFTNPMGNVLGAFLAAMLYDTLGPALLVTLNADQFQSTLDLNVRFLRPVRPGRIVGNGRVVHRDAEIAHLEASLIDSNKRTIAVATATAKVIPLAVAKTAV